MNLKWACLLAAVTPHLVWGQAVTRPHWGFVLENFMTARTGAKGASHRFSWIEAQGRLSPNLKVVVSGVCAPLGIAVVNQLDESFVQLGGDSLVVRAGRFRPKYGFGDWSELVYTPIIALPLVRSVPLNRLGLLRSDTGVDLDWTNGDTTVQFAFVDAESDGWQLVPRQWSHAIARLQVSRGALLVALEGLSRLSSGKSRDSIIGLDLKYSTPHGLIVRFEAQKGVDHADNSQGLYFDVFYRPPGLHRTQVGTRLETFRDGNGLNTDRTTVGVRQIVSKELVLSANYSTGNTTPLTGPPGWTLQLMTAVKF